jgi:hypothetical protein
MMRITRDHDLAGEVVPLFRGNFVFDEFLSVVWEARGKRIVLGGDFDLESRWWRAW